MYCVVLDETCVNEYEFKYACNNQGYLQQWPNLTSQWITLLYFQLLLLPYYIDLYLYNGQHNGDCYPRGLEDLVVDDGEMC